MKGTQEDGQGSAAMEVWVGPATTHGRALGHALTSASRRQWRRSVRIDSPRGGVNWAFFLFSKL
jgi:hypothetical protein